MAINNPHLFISTKNSKTGRYDLRETQIKLVNAYLDKVRPGTDHISEKPDYLESQLLFGYLQDMFYAHTNNKLLKNTLYRAQKHEKTQEHMSKLRYINGEARKPKSEREFSLYQQVKEKRDQAQKQAAEAKDYTQKAKQYVSTQISKAEQAKKSAKDAAERQRLAEQATAEEYEQADAYRRRSAISQQTIVNNTAESARIRAEIAREQATLELFRTNLSHLIDGVVGWIGELFADRRKEIQDKFLKQAQSAFERVATNDKTKEKKYTKTAEIEVDNQLTVLDKYQEIFPDIPKSNEVRRMIIKPK